MMARLRKAEAVKDSVGSRPRTADPTEPGSPQAKDADGHRRWRTGQNVPRTSLNEITRTKEEHDSGEHVPDRKKDSSHVSELQIVELDDEDASQTSTDDESQQPNEESSQDEQQTSTKDHDPEGSTVAGASNSPTQMASSTPERHAYRDQDDDTDGLSDSSGSSSSSDNDGGSGGDGNYSDMSDFIVDDSASETELRRGARRPRRTPPVTRSPRRLVRRSPAKRSPVLDTDSDDDEVRISQPDGQTENVVDARSLWERSGDCDRGNVSRMADVNSKQGAHGHNVMALADQLDATLRLSPPSATRGGSDSDEDRITTPPPDSPSRRLLKSPTRNRMNIPTSPHRQSVDAFWSQNKTNDWNDEHSPSKKLNLQDRLRHFHISPGRGQISKPVIVDSDLDEFKSSDDEGFHTPSDVLPTKTPRRRSITRRTESPEKSPSKTPASPSKMRDPAQRAFLEAGRQRLAASFLDQLLDTIRVSPTDESPARLLFETCGGVKIRWSKTLQKTAGRARVTRRKGHGRLTVEQAEIELAEKVLWTEYQVYNTLAHEFCHLLTMATYPKASAHGREFYHFAHEVERKIPEPAPGVKVKITTKHSYEIQFKYVWQCEMCRREIGRHSKSLPERATHKVCGGRFIQIKPVPRKLAARPGIADGSSPIKSTWQTFQQSNYKLVQQQLTAADGKQPAMKEVMSKLSEMWKAQKNAQTRSERTMPVHIGAASQDNLDRRTGKEDVQITKTAEISDEEDEEEEEDDDDNNSATEDERDDVCVDE